MTPLNAYPQFMYAPSLVSDNGISEKQVSTAVAAAAFYAQITICTILPAQVTSIGHWGQKIGVSYGLLLSIQVSLNLQGSSLL